jgi:multidrug efflux pump subunit AcrB
MIKKAQGIVESGGNYNQSGPKGSIFGKYQVTEDTREDTFKNSKKLNSMFKDFKEFNEAFKGNAVENGKKFKSEYPAVTLSVSKVKGADAMKISEQILDKVNELKKTLIPNDVHVEVTRNYGETASHKVSELLMHLGVAILAVTVLVMLAMGWRGGLVVFFSVPLTFALTLFSYYMLGYTLNRITLFALVYVVCVVNK